MSATSAALDPNGMLKVQDKTAVSIIGQPHFFPHSSCYVLHICITNGQILMLLITALCDQVSGRALFFSNFAFFYKARQRVASVSKLQAAFTWAPFACNSYSPLVAIDFQCALLSIILRYLRGKNTACLAIRPSTTNRAAHVDAYNMWSIGIVANLTRSRLFLGIGKVGGLNSSGARRLASSGDSRFII